MPKVSLWHGAVLTAVSCYPAPQVKPANSFYQKTTATVTPRAFLTLCY